MICSCYVGPRGRENTVACRGHHLMPDGCVAADHEVRCVCGNFKCDHDTTAYERHDDDGYNLVNVCGECEPALRNEGWCVAPTSTSPATQKTETAE